MHTTTRSHTRFASGAALSAAVLAATLAPMPALAGPGEGALALDISVVKIDSDTGERLDGAVFEISTDIDEPHIVTGPDVDFAYGWMDFRSTCDLPDPLADPGGYRAAERDCRVDFLEDAYGADEADTVTATGGFRVFSPHHPSAVPPWDTATITLTEVEGPAGFVLDPEPIVIEMRPVPFEFSLVSGPDGVTVAGEPWSSYRQEATITVPNDPEPEPPVTEEPADPEPEPSPTPPSATTPPPAPQPSATTPPAPAPEPVRAGPIVQTGASGDASTWLTAQRHIHRFIDALRD